LSRLRLAWDLFRAEGLRGLGERAGERAGERRERRAEREVAPESLPGPAAGIAVLDVLSTPLAARFGGVPTQLRPRLEEEGRLRPTALLSPEAGSWVLRTTRGGERLRARLGPGPAESGPAGGLGPGVETVRAAAERLGARIVNVEGVAGWSPAALASLAGAGRKLVVSLHDFALFCPRPNLVEEPSSRFCGYSRDSLRCRACLGATWDLPAGFVEAWREGSAALLSAADAVVYPSEFLRRRHAELFPPPAPRLERVIAPPSPAEAAHRGEAVGAAGPRRRGALHVAFVGAYRPHKGALVFEEVVRRASSPGSPRWSVFGSGEPRLLLRAKRLGVRVLGHYRAGSLPRRLREERVDLALLLSIWPETFSLTLSECRAAGVPVLAFGHGAISERVAAEGGGILVPPAEGAEGVAAALAELHAGRVVPPFRPAGPSPAAGGAAAERLALYRLLLGEAA
jgi:glycosyltransferase involved in cell wall biosynthesis